MVCQLLKGPFEQNVQAAMQHDGALNCPWAQTVSSALLPDTTSRLNSLQGDTRRDQARPAPPAQVMPARNQQTSDSSHIFYCLLPAMWPPYAMTG